MSEIVRSIRKVGIELSKWAGYATATIDRIKLDEVKMPKNHLSCEFGIWYAKDEWSLSAFKEYDLLGEHHIKMHMIYEEMLAFIGQERKVSIFKKMIGSVSELSKAEKKQLKDMYQKFSLESKIVLKLLKDLQNRLKVTDSVLPLSQAA